MKKLVLFLAIVCLSFPTSGCSTMEGAGKDIETLGEEIEETAQ